MSTMARVPSLLVIVLCAVLAAALFASCSPLAIVNAGRHIFPGSCIPSVAVMSDALARVTDMRVCHLEDIGAHYATTLRRWRENLLANLDRVRALGYSEEFIRMWEFYFCYCEGGFAERAIGNVQMLLVKPDARP